MAECCVCSQQLMLDGDGAPPLVCSECGWHVCESCARTCSECGKMLCSRCSRDCDGCSAHMCPACCSYCDQCGNRLCSACIDEQCDCGEHCVCSDCQRPRQDCGCRAWSCETCECSNCGESICGACRYICSNCGECYCGACFGNGEYCTSCTQDEDSDDCYGDGIHGHDYKPRWQFSKQQWENTVYLGIELEINFSRSQRQEVFDVVASHLPQGKYLWKEDGSIGEGAELVIHPCTLQYLRSLPLRAMLKRLSEVGARSYQSGLCGLHVHISKDSFPNDRHIKKLIRLFWQCSGPLARFSQRGDAELNRWCRICPTESFERYVAVNTCPDHTVEIRLFRGTLSWDRFWASLQLCEALVYFVRSHGAALIESGRCWTAFRSFIANGIYGRLERYLTSKLSEVEACA